MTAKLVLENMRHRPMRSLLSFLLIGVPVTLILTLVGLANGMSEDSKHRQAGVGADIVFRSSTATTAISLSGAFPERYVDLLEQQPHVTMALGVLTHSLDLPLFISGIDLPKFNKMSGGFTYLSGGPLVNPDDILIDEPYATQKHAKVGDTISLLNQKWHVAGIIGGGKLARIVVDIKTLQDLDDAHGKVSQIYLKLDNPALTNDVVEQLRKTFPGNQINSMEDFISAFSPTRIPGVGPFIAVIVGVGVIIGFAVVCLSMYMSVLQRTREIGILKALGASKSFIVGIILVEALILAIGGTILGIVMSYGAYWVIHTFVPASIPMIIVYRWWPIAGGVTLIGAALGSLYPGFNAARHDAIEALAYE